MMMENIYTEFLSKICLGTAQLGMDYGIANSNGKPDTDEINSILNFGLKSGIVSLDTAHSYGSSEQAIGDFIKNSNINFRIISKLPPLAKNIDIEKSVFESLSRLNISSIYGYLIHKFDDFLNHQSLWEHLESLKQKKIIEKIGFSIYTPRELEIIFKKSVSFDIIQIPYSIFDRRFESYLPKLKERKIEVYSRSVFLQGLVYLKPQSLLGNLKKVRKPLEKLRKIALSNNVSISALCLNYVALNPSVDKVIVGVDSLKHFEENVNFLQYTGQVVALKPCLDDLEIEDENILLPYKWNKV